MYIIRFKYVCVCCQTRNTKRRFVADAALRLIVEPPPVIDSESRLPPPLHGIDAYSVRKVEKLEAFLVYSVVSCQQACHLRANFTDIVYVHFDMNVQFVIQYIWSKSDGWRGVRGGIKSVGCNSMNDGE